MEIVTLNQENLAKEHVCCAIADKKTANGVTLKKAWLHDRFSEGLFFKKANVRGKVFIEYLPAENAWVPIEAAGYMFINCFWVAGSYKGQGYGARLLEECMNDSMGKNGIAVITSHKKKPYLSDKSYLLQKGFEVCDTAPPYFELLVKRFNEAAPLPKFRDTAKAVTIDDKEGLVVLYTDQCPFIDFYITAELDEIEKQYNIQVKKVKIQSRDQAQNAPAAFTTYSAFYNGNFLTHEILTKSKFAKLWEKI
ncbi:GNAT family N-acetyltransferase [Sporomusa sp.]|uniref:GNAT family N-acetyltransferase n=1 Tax=Sporomusa sp. TaxID=2078658 RepID=UPI002CB10B2F|nr:GNAT family N-acetyltransferase [Sporomusa sp.]HWR43606.1 GNAT family N-acetyltransferase [Sporomusa sp.]